MLNSLTPFPTLNFSLILFKLHIVDAVLITANCFESILGYIIFLFVSKNGVSSFVFARSGKNTPKKFKELFCEHGELEPSYSQKSLFFVTESEYWSTMSYFLLGWTIIADIEITLCSKKWFFVQIVAPIPGCTYEIENIVTPKKES